MAKLQSQVFSYKNNAVLFLQYEIQTFVQNMETFSFLKATDQGIAFLIKKSCLETLK